MAVSTLAKCLQNRTTQLHNLRLELQCRTLTTKHFSPTIAYLTKREPAQSVSTSKLGLWEQPTERPLSILLCWLMAKTRAVNKYASYYLDKGYDVLTVRISPTQLLLPVKTNRIVETELMPLLRKSNHPRSIVHGFSVGGYVFAQMLRLANENPAEYGPVVAKMVAQIWDSVVDVQGTAIGVSKSVFPNAPLPQKLLKDYIDFHMKAMESISTKHYHTAHEYFYNYPLKAPALFLNSENDPISPMNTINAVSDTWKSNSNISVTHKVWANTPHVGHMQRHPDEYKATLNTFLDKSGLKGTPGARDTSAKEILQDFNPAHNVAF